MKKKYIRNIAILHCCLLAMPGIGMANEKGSAGNDDYVLPEVVVTAIPLDKYLVWDNACIEAFHALIKREWLNRYKIFDYRHAYRLIFEYIETFYNTRRIHGHCGYLSPNEYEKEHKALQLAS